MESIAGKFVEQLPAPLFGAIALVCLFAWILKESKDLARIGQVLGLRSFQAFGLVVVGTVAIYYGYIGFRILHPSIEFARNERGISLFGIERDETGAVQAEMYESIRVALDTNQFASDLRVKRNAIHFSDEIDDVARHCKKINATVCAWGTFVPPSTAIMHAILSNDPKIPAHSTMPDYHDPAAFVRQIIQLAAGSLPAGSSDETATPYVQGKLKSLEDSQNSLAKRVQVLEQKLLDAASSQTTPSHAPEGLTGEFRRHRVGLFIGVSDYRKAPRLRFSAQDAQSMFKVATHLWPQTDFSLLSDAGATRSAILAAMQKLTDQAKTEDQVWVYLSGHTVSVKGDAYFLPVDADPNDVPASGISFAQIRSWFADLGAKQGIVFIDSCYSGAITSQLPMGVSLEGVPLNWNAGTGRVLFTATGSNELAFEDVNVGHGLFTDALLSGLQDKSAWVVTPSRLFLHIREKMMGYASRGVTQSPSFYTSVTDGEIAIAPGRATAP
jgi:hypothetical protein